MRPKDKGHSALLDRYAVWNSQPWQRELGGSRDRHVRTADFFT